jgi:DNA (cytosine-5)-methyltransferase 1
MSKFYFDIPGDKFEYDINYLNQMLKAQDAVFEQEEIYLKKQFRLITGREAARLQGFPETFKIHKNEKIAKKQFGNAVPTNVVFEVARNIVNSLYEKKATS